jgi:hypothetical protein
MHLAGYRLNSCRHLQHRVKLDRPAPIRTLCHRHLMATPREIIDQVPVRFDKALREGDVFYFPSTIHKHMEKDIEVILDLDLSRCW